MNQTIAENQNGLEGVNAPRLFLASRVALVSTSVVFGVVLSLLPQLTETFKLSQAEAGWIGGATLWGFAISIWIFGPLCDKIGMGRLMRIAMACHIVGPVMMIFAGSIGGFIPLFIGGLIIALGNGTVQAVINPLVATIFPDESQRIQKMNLLHMWFPGGIALGAFLSFLIDKAVGPDAAIAAWQLKLALVFVPTVAYGILYTAQIFPKTEQGQAGASFADMCAGTFASPLFWVLFICMGISASIELAPLTWMSKAMSESMAEAIPKLGDGAGVLVAVYTSLLVMIMRLNAGPIVSRISPIGLLAMSAVLAGVGLYGLTHVSTAVPIVVLATVYAMGYCYFWPTMLGVTSMWISKGGALPLSLMNGWGMLVTGLIATPLMGLIADRNDGDMLPSFRWVAASAVVLLALYAVVFVLHKAHAAKEAK